MNEQMLTELLDKQSISDVIMTYARAIDRLDETMLRSVFHPDSQHAHGFEGPSSDPSLPSEPGKPGDFVAFAFGVLNTHTRTHHQLGNIFIELEGGCKGCPGARMTMKNGIETLLKERIPEVKEVLDVTDHM